MNASLESAVNAMIEASGGRIWIVSGDRSNDEQQQLWDNAVAKYGPDEARNWVAPPGSSNHEKGEAVDIGGDLEWAQANAARFGLHAPMSWEPWHFERADFSSDGAAYTTERTSAATATPESEVIADPTLTRSDAGDPMQMLLRMLGVSVPTIGGGSVTSGAPSLMGFTTPQSGIASSGLTDTTPAPTAGAVTTASRITAGGMSDLQRFLSAIREIESGGDYRVAGPMTPWGTAKGAYQYLDSTWDGYAGYASASDAPPEVQDERALNDFQSAYSRYGSWASVAAQHYAGPNQSRWEFQETKDYVAKVLAAMARY